MELTDAIQYLKIKGFTNNRSYSWINSILDKALNNELGNEDIEQLISTITKKEVNPKENRETEDKTAAVKELKPVNKIEVAEIIEICEVNNSGLLNITEPIKLKSDLNIFYGMNGVGKSSIYKAICGALGTENKKCVPNVNSEDSSILTRVKIKDKTGNQQTLKFTGEKIETLDVRIFDSEVSRSIVSNDHENEFYMPYLKQEYFFILRDLLDSISERLSTEKTNITRRINEIKQLLNKTLHFLNNDYAAIQKTIKDAKFTDEDRQILEDLNKSKVLLESNTSKVILQSYTDRLNDIEKILKKLCDINTIDGKPEYTIKYGTWFIDDYKTDLKSYIECKALYECNNIKKIGEYIPEGWLNKAEWYAFVEAGLSFVTSLTGKDKELYPDKKCPFCNQDLSSKSKELIYSYNNLKNNCKVDMDKHKTKIDNFQKEINDLLNSMDDTEKVIIKVFDSIKEIDDKQVYDFNSIKVKEYLNIIKEALEKYEQFESKGFADYSASVNRIIEYRKILSSKVLFITKQIAEKDKQIEKLENNIKPLETNKTIIENISILNELVDNLKIIDDIDKKIPNLVTLKSNLSRNQTSFSNESIMKLFKESLFEEYKELCFQPPEKLSIKPQRNKRLCRIGDYKVSDIYSEGEMKIHSLAEFFAKAQIDQYKGVYIFDDPVNSLDYERIEYVKNRINKLVSDGNQVLVFTHNIYFLNSLVDTEKEKVCEVVKANDQVCLINENILGNKDKPIKQYKDKIEKRMRELSKKDIIDIDDMDLSGVYDLISGCLENYVENKLLNGLIGRYRPNIRMYSLQELKSIDDNIVDKIYDLYNNTSRYGNRHDAPLGLLPPSYDNLKTHYEVFKSIVG